MAAQADSDDHATVVSDRSLRLVITGRVWELVIRQLTSGAHAAGMALLRQHGTATAIEFLCDDMQLLPLLPTGDQLKPLDDWLVFTVDRSQWPAPPNVDAFKVNSWQTIIWVNLSANDPSKWSSMVLRHGRPLALRSIEMIGSGMHLCGRSSLLFGKHMSATSTLAPSRSLCFPVKRAFRTFEVGRSGRRQLHHDCESMPHH